MRYSTTLALALAVLAVALAVYILRDRLTGEGTETEPTAGAVPLVEDLALADVSSAALAERRDGELVTKAAFAKTDGRWRILEPLQAPADDYEVERFLQAALEAKVRQTFTPGPSASPGGESAEAGAEGRPRLEDLDLEPPAFRLTLQAVSAADRPERTVAVDIGRRGALGQGVYVRLDGGKQVAVLEDDGLLALAADKIETFRSRDISAPAGDEIVRITLAGPAGAVRLDRSGEDAGRWVLAQPFAARADGEACAAILRQVTGLRVTEFVPSETEDLARFGLEEPRLVVTLFKKAPEEAAKPEKSEGAAEEQVNEEKPAAEPVVAQRLRFGTWADLKKKTVYLAAEDFPGAVTVDASALEPLEKSADELRDKHALVFNKQKVARIEVENSAGRFELAKTGTAWRLRAADREETSADPDAVQRLLSAAEDLKILYFLSDEERNREFPNGLKAQGRLRLHVEGEAAPRGLDVGGTAESRTLLANVREPWIGRAAEKDLEFFQKGWLACLDRTVLAFNPKDVTRLAVRTADRTVRLERAGDAWKIVEPTQADADPAFADGLLESLKNLRAEEWLAAGTDYKPYGLEEGQVVCHLGLTPKTEGAPAEEKVLRLALRDDGTCVGRLDGRDLVARVPAGVFFDAAAEPLPRLLTEFYSAEVKGIEIVAGKKSLRLAKQDDEWVRLDDAGKSAGTVQADAARDMASALARASAARWAAYDSKDPARYGLDKPAFRITVRTDAGETAILVSEKQVPDDLAELVRDRPVRFAMVEGAPRIALLAGAALQTILDAPKSLKP
ncbi:MAG TPA: DUF4340 domain-containing protein [Phycisphaerae bacterium]|nr:DUF4340 domain-containing protein [Phycisphaerae bacterium]